MALGEEKRARCFAWFVLLVSRDCCVALPRGALGLSAVCDCGISKSYSLSLTIFYLRTFCKSYSVLLVYMV